jgi:glycosyltransferase involved in cell wall biosynthesis
VTAIHQLLPALHAGDAVGNEALLLQAALRRAGLASEIFAGQVDPALLGLARPLREAAGEATWLFHFGPDSPAGRLFPRLAGTRVLRYHNVTPPELLADHAPALARLCAAGRAEVRELAASADLGLGASEFNRRELAAMGYARTAVLPLVVDLERVRAAAPNRVLARLLGDGRRNLLVVGRLAPNKRIEDAIATCAVFQRLFDPRARLVIAGGGEGFEGYRAALERRARALRAERVLFLGRVAEDELAACFQSAAALLCTSEHEGVGVPLLEAMACDVPVFAYDAGAVRETLDGAGVLLGDKRPEAWAGALERVLADPALRAAVVAGQRAALHRRAAADPVATLRAALAGEGGGAGAEEGSPSDGAPAGPPANSLRRRNPI